MDYSYPELLKRIITGAEYLSNPLITEEDFIKGMQLYDKLCVQAIEKRKTFEGEIHDEH